MTWNIPFSMAVEIASDVLLKGTAVLVVASVVAWFFRTKSAAIRHVVWSLAFVVLLALPLLSAVLPSWRVELFRMSVPPEVAATRVEGVTIADPSAHRPLFGSIGENAANASQHPDSKSILALVGVAFWLTGILLVLARFGVDAIRVRGIIKRSAGRMSSSLSDTAAVVAKQLGICRRSVQVLLSDEVCMPSSVGVWSPKVIVPVEAARWPRERIHTVLVHELAHVARWDYLVYLVVEVARAVYWLNPLVWFAARRHEMERERACDDHILGLGIGSVVYATTLLEMAREHAAPTTALAMARRSGLEERIRSVMSRDADRSPPTRRWLSIAALAAAALAMPLGAFELLQVEQIEQSVDQLIQQLRDDDPAVRRRAAWALGEREDGRGVNPLIGQLGDRSADVRLVVAWALGEIKDPGAIAPLIAALDEDDDLLVKEMAALALGEIEDPAAVRALMVALEERAELRGPVVWALGEIDGDEAASARAMAFDEWRRVPWDNDDVWLGSLGSGGAAMSDDVAVLVGRLADTNPEVRRSAAWNLALLNDVRAVDPLLDALRDPDPAVRAMAVWALDEINPSDDGGR